MRLTRPNTVAEIVADRLVLAQRKNHCSVKAAAGFLN